MMHRCFALILAIAMLAGSALATAEQLSLPDGLTAIEEEAFMGVSEVDEIVVPEGTVSVGDRAFKDMCALRRIVLPESATDIGSDILEGAMEAVLVECPANSAAMRYAVANRLDYDADTTCRALIIGNTYPGTDNALKGCDNDAYGMESMLERLSGRRFLTRTVINAGRQQCDSLIAETFSDAKEQDISVFYYSGHGFSGGALYMADGNGYPAEHLRQQLDAVPGRKLLLIDACYSGGMIDDGDAASNATNGAGELRAFQNDFLSAFRSGGDRKAAFNPSEYFLLTAARWDQTSLTVGYSSDASSWFSLFTWCLCKGCGYDYSKDKERELEADADGDSAVSVQEAAGYILAEVERMYDNLEWDSARMQLVQAYPAGCRWFAPFRQ